MFFNEIYLPRVSDLNRNGKLSYEAILQILETAGSHHSSKVKDNVIEGSQQGIAWILVDWRISVLRRTDSTDELNITTWVRGKSGTASVYRDFILTDNAGNEVIRAEAKFCLMNLNSGKLVRIGEELMKAYKPEEKIVFEADAPRLRVPAVLLTEQNLNLRRSDIDFNGHVHNTRYMDYALEAIPQKVFTADAFTGIRIVYVKPVKEKTSVKAKYAVTESGHFVGIYADETLCAMIELK